MSVKKLPCLYAPQTGYLELFDVAKAGSILQDYAGVFLLQVKTGDFVARGQELAVLLLDRQDEAAEIEFDKPTAEDLAASASDLVTSSGKSTEGIGLAKSGGLEKRLLNCFTFLDRKVALIDYRYGLDKLMDICINSLASGVNGPNTSIHVIRLLSLLLSRLAGVDESHHCEKLSSMEIYYSSNSLASDLYHVFSPILNLGKDNPVVTATIFDSLRIIYAAATDQNKEIVRDFAVSVYRDTKPTYMLTYDQDFVEKSFAFFEKLA